MTKILKKEKEKGKFNDMEELVPSAHYINFCKDLMTLIDNLFHQFKANIYLSQICICQLV